MIKNTKETQKKHKETQKKHKETQKKHKRNTKETQKHRHELCVICACVFGQGVSFVFFCMLRHFCFWVVWKTPRHHQQKPCQISLHYSKDQIKTGS